MDPPREMARGEARKGGQECHGSKGRAILACKTKQCSALRRGGYQDVRSTHDPFARGIEPRARSCFGPPTAQALGHCPPRPLSIFRACPGKRRSAFSPCPTLDGCSGDGRAGFGRESSSIHPGISQAWRVSSCSILELWSPCSIVASLITAGL